MTRQAFRKLRIAALLLLLLAVAGYAWADVKSRRARHEWKRTLNVAIVLLEAESVDPAAIDALKARIPALEAQLASEQARYQRGAPLPFHFELFGPAGVSRTPPPLGEGLWDLVHYTWELRRYVHAVDEAVGLRAGAFDSKIYATLWLPKLRRQSRVEGQSEQGGRIGQVRVELTPAMADLALIVVTHELLHTLGATDKYAPDGSTLVPEGLADPTKVPRYPQSQVEIMARDRPIAEGQELVPSTLAELGIGPTTAHEIGWSP